MDGKIAVGYVVASTKYTNEYIFANKFFFFYYFFYLHHTILYTLNVDKSDSNQIVTRTLLLCFTNCILVSMFTKKTAEKNDSHVLSPMQFGIIVAAVVSYFVIFATPIILELPVQITEEVKIIAVTEKGVVIETSSGVAVITDQYKGLPGDIIKVSYDVPLKYLEDKRIIQAKYDVFHPDP